MRAAASVALCILAASGPLAQGVSPADLTQALEAALRPALPFPAAQLDGTPREGDTTPVWTVRWPEPGSLAIEVVANPLNPDNRARALKVEAEIQKAAMAVQRESQADYERAVSDFARTGKVSGIREVTLGDEGLAGERYDAESQLLVRAERFEARYDATVNSSRTPEVLPAGNGPAVVIRVAANTYVQEASTDEPAVTHFCPEQAWVFFGAAEPAVSQEGATVAALSVRAAASTSAGLVVTLRGNAELVGRVLRDADWSLLRARFGG